MHVLYKVKNSLFAGLGLINCTCNNLNYYLIREWPGRENIVEWIILKSKSNNERI